MKEGSTIVVTYYAVLNEKAIIGTDGNPNKVKLEYSNDPTQNTTGETKESEVKVFTWEIPVAKVDDKGSALTGAEFSLYKDEACKTVVDVVATETAGIYKVCTKNDSADGHKHIITITTDSNGKLQIEGLEQGAYYLKETKAPAGYNLLTDAIKIVIGADGALAAGDAETTTSEVVVENRAGTVLPETGGIGTTIFYVAGGALVLAAVVLLITKKRMASEE